MSSDMRSVPDLNIAGSRKAIGHDIEVVVVVLNNNNNNNNERFMELKIANNVAPYNERSLSSISNSGFIWRMQKAALQSRSSVCIINNTDIVMHFIEFTHRKRQTGQKQDEM